MPSTFSVCTSSPSVRCVTVDIAALQPNDSYLVVRFWQDDLSQSISTYHGGYRVGVGIPLGYDASTGHNASTPIAFTFLSHDPNTNAQIQSYRCVLVLKLELANVRWETDRDAA